MELSWSWLDDIQAPITPWPGRQGQARSLDDGHRGVDEAVQVDLNIVLIQLDE